MSDKNLTRALVDITTMKRLVGFYDQVLARAASSTGEGRWSYGSSRTKDDIIKKLYPGIDINELRKRRNYYQDEMKRVQKAVKEANWQSGIIGRLDDVEEKNAKLDKHVEEIKNNVRVYDEDVDDVPDVNVLIDVVEGTIRELAEISYSLQLANMNTGVDY